ncbi:hypothetical protein [Thalassolituus oleivorans]|uniref:hypothetical protein n=1 Tax=Thalassolituus oleivorans TaxID=187493 RepID=UPI001CE308D6|nr:hypothetical protein [Thalassolituus oleivorans]
MKKNLVAKEQYKAITLHGKYIKISVKPKNTIQSIEQFKEVINRIDSFFDSMKEEFDINIFHKNKPHKRLIEAIGVDTKNIKETDSSTTINCILANIGSILYGLRELKIINEAAFLAIRRNLIRNSS